jgi:hypothetical protein
LGWCVKASFPRGEGAYRSLQEMGRLSENAHLPFDKLMALSNTEGLRYPHPPPC